MNYFGKMEWSLFDRIECRMRCCKLSLRRYISESLLVLIGRFEELKFRLKPRSRERILLPDFFIVGAQKSGTTSLATWLDQLPGFNIAKMKVHHQKIVRWEIQFFNDPMVRARGLEWYSKRFTRGSINGDKTPEYLFRKSALREIKRICPDAKIILMLRNPVDRAYSAYKQYSRIYPRSRNWDWLLPERSFEDNIKAEEYSGFSIGLLARGRYAEQLEYVYSIYPCEQVRVVIFERFISSPAEHLEEIAAFLGCPIRNSQVSYEPANVGGYRSTMDEGTRHALNAYYRDCNEKLFNMLGYRIEEWNGQ